MNNQFAEKLNALQAQCKKLRENLSLVDDWDINLPFPEPPAEKDKTDSDWQIFVDDTEEFLKKYSVAEADNIRRLLYSEHINDTVLNDLEIYFHRIKPQEIPCGLVLRFEDKDGKPALVRVKISEDRKYRGFFLV